ncbi:hypothetical protein [Silicimonas sp. MF1-12-2]|uniref:hypothetical protein n=1 Tax=Silicimonas sp. MF1-12-2 TaxID=3384793 RepID=UPI0039B41314
MLKRLLFIIAIALAPAPALADAAGARDRIVTLLRDDGYSEIRISRTLLGRMRFVAKRPDAEREIVINPNTGVILRDYIRFLRRSEGGDDDRRDDRDDDDYDDDDYDDDDYDDDDDESDNSGSGSSNSGSGSDDDESDNSGSGSSDSDDDD